MRVIDPNRQKYNKRIAKLKVCEFCNSKNLKEQECRSLAGEHWRVLVSRYPYLDGNLIIIPKRHFRFMDEITKKEWDELHIIIKRTMGRLAKIFNTKAFNIGMNIGKEAGASIEHMHWQIIPRKVKNITAVNLFADIHLVSISPEKLKKMVEKS